jgi:hypothetical protein
MQLRVTDSRKMLGVWSAPSGSDKKHPEEVVVGKTTKWVDRLKNSHLQVHLAWKAYHFQLWPGICYGLSKLATPLHDVKSILHKLEFEMLSPLGVNQHMKTEWRKLAWEFGGIGLFNISIAQFISWLEVLLQHYGAGFTTSRKLQASIEATQLEEGCKGNPLNEDYHTLGRLATEEWVKAVWERASHDRFTITLNYPMQDPPWERESNLVEIFLENGKTGSELRSINKCRIFHQAIYLSCLSTAEGKKLDPIYFLPPQVNKRMSFH